MPRLFSLMLCALLLATAQAAHSEDSTDLRAALSGLQLNGLFESLQPVVQRELAATDAPAALVQQLERDLAAEPLETALIEELGAAVTSEQIEAAAALGTDSDFIAVTGACHESPKPDLGLDLSAYQAQLRVRPPRAVRSELARQMDSAARTSHITANLHSRVERIIVETTRSLPSEQINWPEVAAERRIALQPSVITWYLYCARFSPDNAMRSWIERYNALPVQRFLDHYEASLAMVLERTALQVASESASAVAP